MSKHDVSLLPYFPLESGLLTGKVTRDKEAPKGSRLALWKGSFTSEEKFDIIDKLNGFGSEIGRNLLEISLAWVANRSQVASVLVGATSPEQMVQNIEAISWNISVEEIQTIDSLVLGDESS